ncbi:MAG: HupE/UreJ family protein [Loktanella sp.]|nr:HupE/UreJ family protein [Loktanella sp.]
MSTFAALMITLASAAQAHEVIPSVADMEQDGSQLRFEVRTSLETFIAGIDQADVSDTNDAPQAETFDALRALEAAALEEAFRDHWPQMSEDIMIEVGGEALALTLDDVTAGPVGDIENPRASSFAFTAALPDGAEAVSVGWDRSLGTLVLRQMGVEAPYDGYLEPGDRTPEIALQGGDQATGWMTFLNYIPVGFDHIVPLGLDHILFVLGLFLLSTRFRPLLWQITAFTLAHTITLALAALGYVNVPASIVEPLIALSIAYVAIENLYTDGLSRWRPFIIFGFGLLHGLGFASVLTEFGLPDSAFIPALIGFNIGVEIGQIAVIAVAYLCVYFAMKTSEAGRSSLAGSAAYLAAMVVAVGLIVPLAGVAPDMVGDIMPVLAVIGVLLGLSAVSVVSEKYDSYREMVTMPASILIALVAVYWCIERVFL